MECCNDSIHISYVSKILKKFEKLFLKKMNLNFDEMKTKLKKKILRRTSKKEMEISDENFTTNH